MSGYLLLKYEVDEARKSSMIVKVTDREQEIKIILIFLWSIIVYNLILIIYIANKINKK
jgi:hypothetical protein